MVTMQHTHTARIVAAGLCSAVVAVPVFAQSVCDPSIVDQRTEEMLDRFPGLLSGASVIVGDRRGILYEGYFGDHDPRTKLALASASKMISGVAMMTLIDSGAINEHAPIVTYLPGIFDPTRAGPVKPFMSVDEMYSMTSGFANGEGTNEIISDLGITLGEAVDMIATEIEPVSVPSTELNYTGLGMHIAGYLCEVTSGVPYDEFYTQAVSDVIGTPSISWDGLGETENFRPSGGGASEARDYARVLRLLLRGGELDGVRLLSEARTETMFVERTVGLDVGSVPPVLLDEDYGYAFGMWVEDRAGDGTPIVFSSPGAFGTTPWIDREDGYWGIVFVEGVGQVLREDIQGIRAAIEDGLIHGSCTPCRADMNHDGSVDYFDVSEFLGYFAAHDRRADFNDNRQFDFFDLSRFLNQVGNGCAGV